MLIDLEFILSFVVITFFAFFWISLLLSDEPTLWSKFIALISAAVYFLLVYLIFKDTFSVLFMERKVLLLLLIPLLLIPLILSLVFVSYSDAFRINDTLKWIVLIMGLIGIYVLFIIPSHVYFHIKSFITQSMLWYLAFSILCAFSYKSLKIVWERFKQDIDYSDMSNKISCFKKKLKSGFIICLFFTSLLILLQERPQEQVSELRKNIYEE